MDRCAACGFDYYGFPRPEIGDRLRARGDEHAERLTETPVAFLRQHPVDGWSALEYGCHVRDVLLNQRSRIELTQREDAPTFVPMGRDELAVNERYNDQAPDTVALRLTQAAGALATLLAALDDTGWARTATYTYPEPALRDVDWIARHTVHELHHHLTDVHRVLKAVLED
ncbi:MAG: DinB family protein [Acidimicrobiales bacterium]